jgi:GNAT superfamily N-acetyltransferase
MHFASQTESDVEIRTIRPEEFAEFVAFLNAGMRPRPLPTRAEDDFPVILGPGNLDGLWGVQDARGWAAGLSVLVRRFTTPAGPVAVAGIGSVVTRADRRGEGLSSRLQAAVLTRLRADGVPLAVLWTDQPEVYAGRGFRPAGWEWHADLAPAALDPALPRGEIREFRLADLADVTMLYEAHALRTLRGTGDAARLYAMPGTSGLVVVRGGRVTAYAFCGKGADFPDYVAEWAGPAELVVPLLAAARARGLASRVLLPPGTDAVRDALLERGAALGAVPCGLWAVLAPASLAAMAIDGPADPGDPVGWLGTVDDHGDPVVGPLTIAVWGLDSV